MRIRGAALFVLGSCCMATAAEPVSFQRDIAPILEKHCLSCHSGPRAKGGLDLSRRDSLAASGANGPVVVPGKSADSTIIRLVADKKMPPKSPLGPESV